MNYLILRTPLGRRYGVRIADELRLLGNRAYLYKVNSIDLAFERHPEWNPNNLIIHVRGAYPFNCNWMNRLYELEGEGYRVVNKPSVLSLTSDKYRCVEYLETRFHLPRTYLKNSPDIDIRTKYTILKPRVSSGGGKFVQRIETKDLDINSIERGTIIQEYIQYAHIYRVFVIGGRALPILTVDSPTANDWKVSVCLNQRQKSITDTFGYAHIIHYAERVQREIGGEINFIDVFTCEDGEMILSEINTACSLLTHERITGYNIAREIARYLNSLK